ncbi:uncharacterized protein [Palaemon carinicauda]|uniref:uncharacterized protein n=1 Tax=Palaemon carinicauda TaxID=392227 RepID=UPI0035B6A0B9
MAVYVITLNDYITIFVLIFFFAILGGILCYNYCACNNSEDFLLRSRIARRRRPRNPSRPDFSQLFKRNVLSNHQPPGYDSSKMNKQRKMPMEEMLYLATQHRKHQKYHKGRTSHASFLTPDKRLPAVKQESSAEDETGSSGGGGGTPSGAHLSYGTMESSSPVIRNYHGSFYVPGRSSGDFASRSANRVFSYLAERHCYSSRAPLVTATTKVNPSRFTTSHDGGFSPNLEETFIPNLTGNLKIEKILH